MKDLNAYYNIRHFLLFYASLQSILAGGLLFGWTGIGDLLTTSLDEGGAGLSSHQCIQIFTIASSLSCFAQLILGAILDKYGPRKCSILSNTIVSLGCFIFSNQHQYYSLIAFGITLIGFGGPGVYISNFHLGNLYPKYSNTVITFISGILTLSFLVFPFINFLWAYYRIKYQVIFKSLGCIILPLSVGTLWLYPNVPFQKHDFDTVPKHDDCHDSNSTLDEIPNNNQESFGDDISMMNITKYRTSSAKPSSSSSLTSIEPSSPSSRKTSSGEKDAIDLIHASFKTQLCCGIYARLSLVYIITSFWANFYLASVALEMQDEAQFDSEVQSKLLQSLTISISFAFIGSPIVGYLIDKFGTVFTSIITCSFGIIQMIILLSISHSDETSISGSNNVNHLMEMKMKVSFIVLSFFRAFLFPYYYASLSSLLGFRYFGLLSGITIALSGIVYLLFMPLSKLAEGSCHDLVVNTDGNSEENLSDCFHGNWRIIHILQIATLSALILMELLYSSGRPIYNVKLLMSYLSPRRKYSTSYGSMNFEGAEMNDMPTIEDESMIV